MVSFETLFATLDRANVRYLVAGGVAVVLHGHLRATADLDLFVDLEEANVRRAVTALGELGYSPRAPVDAREFADASTRRSWVREKNLQVFSLWRDEAPDVDLFVDEPLPFADALDRAERVILGGVEVPVLGLEDLIALKRRAGRAQDLADVEALEAVRREGTP